MLVLFSDFGFQGPYVGQMKAVLHAGAPGVPVVDLMHDAPPFDPQSSAYLLAALAGGLAPGAVVLAIVDPGVGTDRRALVVEADGRWFIGPDNGLFALTVRRASKARAWEITWRPEKLSVSFHGRDLFAPVAAEIAAAGHAPHGPDGPLYPGTCRGLDPARAADRMAAGEAHALRLKTNAAAEMTGPLAWVDLDQGEQIARPELFGDVVLARKDTPTSYHLSVTTDDHIQGVTCVTRGQDLFEATHVHRLLQALLGLDTPVYRHHGLLAGSDGKRLAKRDKAETIESLRAGGHSPANVWAMAGVSAEAMP
ncbi:MAG TPA: hypothetical protein DC046_16375 [Rhodospirillaceae bacterium]|nr:hypothetical protein [Rhodospirillaceae bacterium]